MKEKVGRAPFLLGSRTRSPGIAALERACQGGLFQRVLGLADPEERRPFWPRLRGALTTLKRLPIPSKCAQHASRLPLACVDLQS